MHQPRGSWCSTLPRVVLSVISFEVYSPKIAGDARVMGGPRQGWRFLSTFSALSIPCSCWLLEDRHGAIEPPPNLGYSRPEEKQVGRLVELVGVSEADVHLIPQRKGGPDLVKYLLESLAVRACVAVVQC
jgi:hypothetical protein